MSSEKAQEINEIVLEPDAELRFDVESRNETLTLELKTGFAEIFGSELIKGKPYTFSAGAKFAVFTWQGCTLEFRGKKNFVNIAKETPMMFYLNCHACIEHLRVKAESEIQIKRGPVTMVVGPTDVGKSTVCRLLLNYAVRMDRTPVFVDLDVGQGQISVPGSIGAILVECPADIEEGFPQNAPLVYHYGHTGMDKSLQTFNLLVSKLAEAVQEKLKKDRKTSTSGVIINTCGWVKGEGYRHITHAAQAFEVDIILVLDQEKLYNELVRDMPTFVKVVLLPKSGGVVERNKKFRSDTRDTRIRNYFYGGKVPLQPHSFDVKWSDMKLYKIGSSSTSDSGVSSGMKPESSMTKLVSVQPGPSLLHHLLAVSFASSVDEEVITTNIAGYICITHVDVDSQTFTVLSPQPKPLPETVFILSDVQMNSH